MISKINLRNHTIKLIKKSKIFNKTENKKI